MSIACVILAAGIGKRMNSILPKVLHRVCGAPMLQYVVDAAEGLNPVKKILVVGQHHNEIKSAILGKGISHVTQKEPRGTGDALLSARGVLSNFKGTVLVLNGDIPLISTDTLKRFISHSKKSKDLLSVLSFIAEDPSAYGRILRDSSGKAVKIIEHKDATQEQRKVREVNSGVYALSPDAMSLLKKIKLNKKKGEYYLTDILEIAARDGLKTGVHCADSEVELMGINTRQELLSAEWIMQTKIIDSHIRSGSRFVDPSSVHIHSGVSIGRDAVIYPNVYLEGSTRIGCGSIILPNVRIADSVIGNNAVIKDSSVIEGSVVKHGAQVGPFAHLRPGSTIGPDARIGNFVEVKKSVVGRGTKASHLSYIGDATIGKDVNIGAGTITCNYDGNKKHKTVIRDGVFIGSDTQIVAPVRIGKGAYIGAGSTITKDVPPMSLSISRSKQKNIEGWARKRMKGQGSKVKGQRRGV